MGSEARWATAVRVLALLSLVLAVLAGAEAWTIRRARTDLQQVRDEREEFKATVMSAWARQPAGDVRQALQWLDRFYSFKEEGLGRPGGLCPDSRLDDEAIVTYLFGTFLPARAAGQSEDAALLAMRTAIQRSDAYRAAHPNAVLPPIGR